MLISNDNQYCIVYDDDADADAEHVYNWGGYYYAVNRLAELLQKGVIKRYAEIRETDSYVAVLRVEIKKEVKA